MRDKLGRYLKGIHSSPNTEFKKGSKVNLGRHHTEETKKKIVETKKRKKGKGGRWKGGISIGKNKKQKEEELKDLGMEVHILLGNGRI